MLNSRDISLLRPDVAANCRIFLSRCEQAGWPALVTGTVRDEEYQLDCYRRGTSRSRTPTFHAQHAGLAFDICKNVKGQEYSDGRFWTAVGAIGKEMGFTWGGDWTGIVDKPHFQWDGRGAFSDADIIARRYPPDMPEWRETDEEMTKDEFRRMMDQYLADLSAQEPSDWSREARAFCEERQIINGDENGDRKYKKFLTREELAQIIFNLEHGA